MNTVVLIGRVVKDAEHKVLNNSLQTSVIKFTLAVERDYKDKNGQKIVDFLPVEYFGKSLEKLSSFITKGTRIGINGSINIEKVQEKFFTRIKANKIELLGTNNSNQEPKVQNMGTKVNQMTQEVQFCDDDTPF